MVLMILFPHVQKCLKIKTWSDSMTVSELGDFIINNPSVLKRPIIIEDEKMQVGYNDEEIKFCPQRLRDLVM